MHWTNQKLTMRNLEGIPPSLLGDTCSDPLPRCSRNRLRGALFLILMTLLTLNQLIISHFWAGYAPISRYFI